jgi:hypothetical protein
MEGWAGGVGWEMRLAAALLLLIPAPQQGEDLVCLGLRYLARHRSPNGSWGQRMASCACPDEPETPKPPADPETLPRVNSLLAALDHDDFQKREQALQSLIEIGSPAVPRLRETAAKGSAEAQWRARAALRRLSLLDTADDVEATGMALVAFLGAGYSPLSREIYDGIAFGQVVKEGLEWLIGRMAKDGSFEGATPAAQAWAAVALSEAYGMTASLKLKEPAQRAIDYIADHRAPDARGLLPQGMALKSAELSELTFPRKAAEQIVEALRAKRAAEPASIFTRAAVQLLQIFHFRSKPMLDLTGLPGLDPSRMEMETVYVVGLALFQADGPHGPGWKAFNESEKGRILAAQNHFPGKCDRGSWAAAGTARRLKTCALATLSREIYYR